MRRIIGLLATVLILFPALAGAQPWVTEIFSEQNAITASAATTTQTSALIFKPQDAKGLVVYVDVTVGAVLLLDLSIKAYFPNTTDTVTWFGLCPSADGITGVSSTTCVYTAWGGSNLGQNYGTDIDDFAGILPQLFYLEVVHGNVTAATYTVDYQWLW
jgi:hypothetical protein